jgi:hypothetical protein
LSHQLERIHRNSREQDFEVEVWGG